MRLSVSCLASFVLAVSAVACGGSGSSETASSGGGASAFVGEWTCTANFQGSNSALTIVVTMNQDGSITATESGDAGLNCALTYTVKGVTATVESGQSCAGVNVTGGSTTVGGTPPLSGTLDVSFSGVPFTEQYGCTKS